jgi:phosphatidylglycerol lysyltransferase
MSAGSEGPPTTAAHEARRGRIPVFAFRRITLSLAVAAMGLVDLASALLSRPPERLVALRHLVPTDVLDTSRTFTLLAGALLLVTAWGLRRGKRRAFVAALFLCAISVPFNLLKAFDFEEATVAAGLLFALGISGEAFRVRSRELSLAGLRSRAAWTVLALMLYATAGAWVVKQVYGHEPSWRLAYAEAGYRMFGIGEPVEMVPRSLPPHEARIVTWYLKSLPLMSLVLVLGLALAALRPASHRRRHRADAQRVEELLRAHGNSSVASFALGADVDYFFSDNRRAVIAYRFEADTLLAVGDPVGPEEEIPALLESFARYCADRDWQFAFFQARPERLAHYQRLGWRALHIGEEPVLHTRTFTLEGGAVGDVRRSARKAESAGIEVRHFVPGTSAFDPAHDPALAEGIRAISQEWLHAHPGGERGFCMGRFDPVRLPREWLAVAVHAASGRVEGFVTWVPIWARKGWALDLMRRRLEAHTGTMELLIVRSVEAARERGDAVLSLSLSALARVEEPAPAEGGCAASATAAAAPETDRAREFLMQHLARFYDFKGLFHWKKKFDPRFEHRYLVYPGPLALPRVTLALVKAQSPGGLLSYLQRARPDVAPVPVPPGRMRAPGGTAADTAASSPA